jgi:transcriptional regulator with XRE-family HTH domain
MSDTRERLAAAADRHVGRRLRERRLQRGLSLAEMAGALGISTQQARKYEAGMNGIPAARLPEIAAILGVPAGWFFEEWEEGSRPYRPVLPTRPRMLMDLVRATDELPESGLVALCEAARALAAQPGEYRATATRRSPLRPA